MSDPPAYEPANRQSTLVESLKQQPNYIMEQYNQQMKSQNESKGIKKAGGVYIPPHKLRAMQEQMLNNNPSSEAYQRMMWQLLRKSINGIVNKVNIANIQNIVIELFNQNILRGRGLLARSIIKAQMASPNFTHVYTALIAVINTKVPQIGLLVVKRVLIQFRRSFQRNNKIVCVATTRMIAHLVNQRVLGFYIALQILLVLLSTPTDDSVQIACDFMIQVGQMLSQLTPAGSNAIFERFKSLLHQGQIEQKAQYSIENLFAVRKTGFKQHPGVIPDLDLVEPQDQFTHELDLQEDMKGDQNLNLFKLDKNFQETQAQWDLTKQQILGQENIVRLKQPDEYEEQYDQPEPEQGIQDLTQQDLVNLRKTIYLAIQSTVNFEECAHKILKMNIAKGYEHELIDMILQCCMMERVYQSFFGLLSERFCIYDDKYKELFERAFLNNYNNIFKQEANKIRNLAHLFGHLFHRKVIDWSILEPITLTPDTTTAAARMFLKILFKDIGENLGIDNLAKEFQKQQSKHYYQGLFPIDNPSNLRFAINYYTTIGLGKLTQEMRQVLNYHEEILNQRQRKIQQAQAQLLIQQEEEMMKLMIEQQRIKQEEGKKYAEDYKHQDKKHRNQDRSDRKRHNQRSHNYQEKEFHRGKQQNLTSKRKQKKRRSSQKSNHKKSSSQKQDRRSQSKQDIKISKNKRNRKSSQQNNKRKRGSSSQSVNRNQRYERHRRDRSKQRHNRRNDNQERRQRQDKGKLKQKQRQRQRQRQNKQIQREKQRQKQKQKQREKQRILQQKQRQLERAERQKEKQKERQKQRQRQRERQKERQKQRQKQKERAKKAEEEKKRQKQEQNNRRNQQIERQNKNNRKRYRSRQKSRDKKRSSTPKKRRNERRKSKSPQRKRYTSSKPQIKKRKQSEDSSSVISSSSSDSSSNDKHDVKIAPVRKQNQVSSNSDSSSSSSSESESKNNKGKRRVSSQSDS